MYTRESIIGLIEGYTDVPIDDITVDTHLDHLGIEEVELTKIKDEILYYLDIP